MEELKLLISAIAGLPEMALWAIGGFYLWKLLTLASILAVIKIAIDRIWDWAKTKKAEPKIITKIKHINYQLMSDAYEDLEELFKLIKAPKLNYIHRSDIQKVIVMIQNQKESTTNENEKTTIK